MDREPRQPSFGPNGKAFVIRAIVAVVIGLFVAWFLADRISYWLVCDLMDGLC